MASPCPQHPHDGGAQNGGFGALTTHPRCPGGRAGSGVIVGDPAAPHASPLGISARGGGRGAGVSPSVWRLRPRRLAVSRWHLRPHPDVWVASEPGTKPRPCLAGPALRRKLPRRRCQANPSGEGAGCQRPQGKGRKEVGGRTQPPVPSPWHLSRPAAPGGRATQAGAPPGSQPGPGEVGGGRPCRLLPACAEPETVKLIKDLQQQD